MSDINATLLLKALSAGIRPDASSQPRPSLPIEQQSFTSLLAGAMQNAEPSGRPVEFAQGVTHEFNAEELEQLGAIIDSAEINGSTMLAVLHEGDVFQIDVLTRTVQGVEHFDPSRVLTDIDAVARLDTNAEETNQTLGRNEALAQSAAGMLGVRNSSLASLLSSIAGVIDPDKDEPQSKNHTGAA
jgi:hypothetical protein